MLVHDRRAHAVERTVVLGRAERHRGPAPVLEGWGGVADRFDGLRCRGTDRPSQPLERLPLWLRQRRQMSIDLGRHNRRRLRGAVTISRARAMAYRVRCILGSGAAPSGRYQRMEAEG